MTEVATIGAGFSLTPRNLEEAMHYAKLIADSEIVPKDYRGKPGNVLVAIQMGSEIGLKPMQSLQNISVVNGRPAVWGDSLMAIARAHPLCEYITETFDTGAMTATIRGKRRGGPEEVRTYSKVDAETAKLWAKDTYQQNPKRMLQMRARGFLIRDLFADALRGIAMVEEVQDMPERDVTPNREARAATPLPPYPNEQLVDNLPKWREAMDAGKKTAEEIIGMVETKGRLTEEQKRAIRNAGALEGGAQNAST